MDNEYMNQPEGNRPEGGRPDGSRPDGSRPEGGRPEGGRQDRRGRNGRRGGPNDRRRAPAADAGDAPEAAAQGASRSGESAGEAAANGQNAQNNQSRPNNQGGRNNNRNNRGNQNRGGKNRPDNRAGDRASAANAADASAYAADPASEAAPQASVPRESRTVWSSTKKRPQRPVMPTRPAGAPIDNVVKLPQPLNASSETAEEPRAQAESDFPRAERAERPARPQNQAQAGGDRPIPVQRPPRNPRREQKPAALPQMDNLLIEDCPVEDTDRASSDTDPAELDRILQMEICTPQSMKIPDIIPEGKIVIVGVRFRTGGKTYFFDPGKLTCESGRFAIVETARGQEFGEICLPNRMVDEKLVVPPLRPVIRLASEEDIAHNKENHEREEAAYRIGVEKIKAHKLDMKLVAVQYTFDNAKLLFYFTSAGRVDFRELVKDLAGVFHIRIELRQIGIRDEARMIGGLGTCGRPLCCSTFLSDFGQVSMKMAKEQSLSLNSTKISGCCGRLLCCLRFEYDTYVEEIRRTPAVGSFVNTPDGPGVVTEMMPLLGEVKVSLRNSPDSAPKKYKRDDLTPQVPGARPGAERPSAPTDEASANGDTAPVRAGRAAPVFAPADDAPAAPAEAAAADVETAADAGMDEDAAPADLSLPNGDEETDSDLV